MSKLKFCYLICAFALISTGSAAAISRPGSGSYYPDGSGNDEIYRTPYSYCYFDPKSLYACGENCTVPGGSQPAPGPICIHQDDVNFPDVRTIQQVLSNVLNCQQVNTYGENHGCEVYYQ